MVSLKVLINTLFLGVLFVSFAPVKSGPTRPINIETLEELRDFVRPFYKTEDVSESESETESDDEISGGPKASSQKPPQKLAIIFDFHGVLVKEKKHTCPLTLSKGSKKLLTTLKEQDIDWVIAAGWPDFKAVQSEIIRLGLHEDLNMDPALEPSLEEIKGPGMESKNIEGYRNGKLVSLRYKGEELFLQKGYALHWLLPDEDYTDVFVLEDTPDNLNEIERNFVGTVHDHKGCKLTLFFVGSNREFARYFPVSNAVSLAPKNDKDSEESD